MSGPGHVRLMTSHFTNVKCIYVGLWLVIYALCLTAEYAPLLSNPLEEPKRVLCLTSFPNPDRGEV